MSTRQSSMNTQYPAPANRLTWLPRTPQNVCPCSSLYPDLDDKSILASNKLTRNHRRNRCFVMPHNKTLLAQATPAGTAYCVVRSKAGRYGAFAWSCSIRKSDRLASARSNCNSFRTFDTRAISAIVNILST